MLLTPIPSPKGERGVKHKQGDQVAGQNSPGANTPQP